MRPDICYGVVQPTAVQEFHLPAPSSAHIDYNSPWLCRISLQAMSGVASQPSPSSIPPLSTSDQNEVVDIGNEETKGKRRLTTMQVGVPEEDGSEVGWPVDEVEEEEEEEEEEKKEEEKDEKEEEEEEEAVVQVAEMCEVVHEEEMEITELPDYCFLNCDERGKTFLNVLNPDIGVGQCFLNFTSIDGVVVVVVVGGGGFFQCTVR